MVPETDHSPPKIALSQDAWPIVRLVFAGSVTPGAFREFMSELFAVAARSQREHRRMGLLVLLESLNPGHVTAAMRKEHAALLRECLPRLADAIFAEARVVTHPVVRGVLTAMTWLIPHPWPVAVFASERDAQEWLRLQDTDQMSQPPDDDPTLR